MVELVDHPSQLLVADVLPELPGDPPQVPQADPPGLVVVEQPEGLQDLLPGVPLQDAVRHCGGGLVLAIRGRGAALTPQRAELTDFVEVLEGDLSGPVPVVVPEDLQDVHLLHLEAERAHRHLGISLW